MSENNERRDFIRRVKDRMFFKCTPSSGVHRPDGPLPPGVLCEGCVRDELESAETNPCPAAQRGEPDKGFCVLPRGHRDQPHRHADGSEWWP